MLVKFTTAKLLGKDGHINNIQHEAETYVIKFHHTQYWIQSKPGRKVRPNARRECECVIKQLIPEKTYNEIIKNNPNDKDKLQIVKNNHYFILAKAKATSIERSADMYCKAIGREISLRKALNALTKVNSAVYDNYFVAHILEELHNQCPHGLERARSVLCKEYLRDSRIHEIKPMHEAKKLEVKDEARDIGLAEGKREIKKPVVKMMILAAKDGTKPNG